MTIPDPEIIEAINVAWLKTLREIYECRQASGPFTAEQESLCLSMFKLGFKSGCEWFGEVTGRHHEHN